MPRTRFELAYHNGRGIQAYYPFMNTVTRLEMLFEEFHEEHFDI